MTLKFIVLHESGIVNHVQCLRLVTLIPLPPLPAEVSRFSRAFMPAIVAALRHDGSIGALLHETISAILRGSANLFIQIVVNTKQKGTI